MILVWLFVLSHAVTVVLAHPAESSTEQNQLRKTSALHSEHTSALRSKQKQHVYSVQHVSKLYARLTQ